MKPFRISYADEADNAIINNFVESNGKLLPYLLFSPLVALITAKPSLVHLGLWGTGLMVSALLCVIVSFATLILVPEILVRLISTMNEFTTNDRYQVVQKNFAGRIALLIKQFNGSLKTSFWVVVMLTFALLITYGFGLNTHVPMALMTIGVIVLPPFWGIIAVACAGYHAAKFV